MKKLIAGSLSIIALISLMVTSAAFAGPNDVLNDKDRVEVFNQLLYTRPLEVQNEIRSNYSGTPNTYLVFTSIKLAKNRQTFWVSGNAVPFVGANKSNCWLYEKSDGVMHQILDFELCDNVSVLKTKHHGYSDVMDDETVGYKQEKWIRIFRFDGVRYQEKPQRKK